MRADLDHVPDVVETGADPGPARAARGHPARRLAAEGPAARRLAAEVAGLEARRPRLAARARWAWARPGLVILPLAAILVGTLGALPPIGDDGMFCAAGMAMWGPGGLDTFAEPALQIGPVYLAVLGAMARAATAAHLPLYATVGAVQAVLLTWFAMWTARRLARDAGVPPLPAVWAVGLALVLGGLLAEAGSDGHPEEILLALLLANGALDAARGRWWRAGLLTGLAAGSKLWAVLAGGMLVRGHRLRGAVVACLVAAGVLALAYAPFALGGHVRTFEFSWDVLHHSWLGSLAHWAGLSDWGARVLQGGVAGLSGVALAWRGRFSPLVPVIVAIAVRLLLDPLRLPYYAGPLVVLLVVWAWSAGRGGAWALVISSATPVVVLAPYLLDDGVLSVLGSAALLAVTVGVPLRDRWVAAEGERGRSSPTGPRIRWRGRARAA